MSSAGAGFTITNAASQSEKRKDRRTILFRVVFAFVFFIVSLWLIAAAVRSDVFFQSYSRFSRDAGALIATFFSLFPFSFAEALVYAFSLFWIVYLVFLIRRLIVRPRRAAAVLRSFSLILLTASIIFLLFISLWGLNYLAPPLSEKLELDVKKTTVEELVKTTLICLKNANEYSYKVQRDQSGNCSFGSFSDMAEGAREAQIGLMRRFDILKAPYCPAPKPVLSSGMMSYFGITGIYFPLTGESNVNTDYVASHMPFVMTHELSHRLGTAPEDEANFLAFLSCTGSDDPDFIYSGYLSAYIYAINKVYELSPDAAAQIAALQADAVTFDIIALDEYIKKYEGPVSDIGNEINNTYLHSMGQKEGVRSYGRMVDLLIAYFNSPLYAGNVS